MTFFDGFWFALGIIGAFVAVFAVLCVFVAVTAFFDKISGGGED